MNVFVQKFSPMMASLNPVIVAITSLLIRLHEAGTYSTVAVGMLLSRVNVIHVVLPARSVSMSSYVPSPVMIVPLIYIAPLSVAHE